MTDGKGIYLMDRCIMLSILGKEVSYCCFCFFHFNRCVMIVLGDFGTSRGII
jgi:hypothetical protein